MNASVKFFGTLILFLVAVYLFAMLFTDITTYILIATLLTTILLPVTERLSHVSVVGYKIPRGVSAMISFCFLFAVIGVFASLFIPLVQEQVQNISNIDDKKLSVDYNEIVSWADQILVNYGFFEKTGGLFKELEKIKGAIVHQVQVKNIFSFLFSITGNVLVGIMAVGFMSFFFLIEKGQLRMTCLEIIPNKYFEFFVTAYHKIQSLLRSYLTGLLIQMVVIFSLTTLGLTLVGVKYAVTIGCFTAVANLIPYTGPFLGASFGAIIGISTSTNLGPEFTQYFVLVGKIASVFAVVQITDNIFLQPIIFSKSIKAHPLEIFVVIFAGANLAGAIGMILAIPVYTILKVALIEIKFGYSQYHIFKS